jgi:integral membrane protein
MKFNIQVFRIIAFAEGCSFLALFCITMPLKYLAKIEEPNHYVGMAHGLLFVAYIAMLIVVGFKLRWGAKNWILSFAASIIPFGTFWADFKIFKPEQKKI